MPGPALAFPRTAATSADFGLFKPAQPGAGFSTDLDHGRIAADGGAAVFQPENSAGPGLASSAYCIYRLRCFRDAETAELVFDWGEQPPAPGTCWLGLPDWENNAWTWGMLPESGVLEVDPALLATLDHTTFVALVVTGDDPAELSQLSCNCTPDGENPYMLFSPYFGNVTYLINMDGDIVHTWTADHGVKYSVYLLDNDHLLRTNRNGQTLTTGKIEEVAWDGEVLWSYQDFPQDLILHHDIQPLPNGNVLAICWELVSPETAIAMGLNPDYAPDQELEIDSIIEIMPTGPDSGEVVWEWRLSDHFVQDFDETKPNYGDIASNPGRFNINFAGESRVDFVHANAVHYNAGLDQIALSLHTPSEIYIIDHSTTTAEAAGSSGGTYGRGGDFLYRWGNPAVYGRGTEGDRQLFGQHDIEWIPAGYPGAGNLLLFNNRNTDPELGSFSTVLELVPPQLEDGSYLLDGTYGPAAPLWTYIADPPDSLYSAAISGSQRLPSGNTLVCSGLSAWFFEVTPEGEIVWEYENELPSPMMRATFRCDRYWLFTPWYDFNALE